MQIELAPDTEDKLTTVSRLLGVKKQEVVDRAVLLYLESMSKYLDLKQEIKQWDLLSDEALNSFEHSL